MGKCRPEVLSLGGNIILGLKAGREGSTSGYSKTLVFRKIKMHKIDTKNAEVEISRRLSRKLVPVDLVFLWVSGILPAPTSDDLLGRMWLALIADPFSNILSWYLVIQASVSSVVVPVIHPVFYDHSQFFSALCLTKKGPVGTFQVAVGSDPQKLYYLHD